MDVINELDDLLFKLKGRCLNEDTKTKQGKRIENLAKKAGAISRVAEEEAEVEFASKEDAKNFFGEAEKDKSLPPATLSGKVVSFSLREKK